jgi:capsular polysaccharide biosynthesis protein
MFKAYDTPRATAPVIREGGVSTRTLPANFHARDAALFEREIERVIPPTRLLELRGVQISHEGILFKQGKSLPESFSSPYTLKYFLSRRRSVLKFLATNRLFRRRKKFDARALWITDDWSNGYFHWLADALPRLFVVGELARSLTLLLPGEYERLEFVQSSLKLFELGGIEYVRAGEVVNCERLLMPTHTAPSGNYNEGLLHELRAFIFAAYGLSDDVSAHRKVYISRARAAKRKIVNEEEVAGVLVEFGFEVFHFEDYGFEEQVRLASEAKYLISNHGAGLTNMLFMPERGSVLELRRKGERERNWFFNLANTAHLNYYYQTCAPEHTSDDPHTANLFVDTERLRENLSLMLSAE